MSKLLTPGAKFRAALQTEKPLQIVGAINAYTAMMAEQVGYQALYLSGSGVATASYGLPDLGITNLHDVLEDIRRITSASSLPLLVDADTGWGNAFNIARTVKEMTIAGAAGLHLEDQVQAKRCGHRPGKEIVSQDEMAHRIKAAVDARVDASFVIMARTDAFANEGMERAVARAIHYLQAGADMIFIEALTDLTQYREFIQQVSAPVLANITEFGKTPLFSLEELQETGVQMVLYPLSAFRAMNAAALKVYKAIRADGTQKNVIDLMQTRAELYEFLRYFSYEEKLNALYK